MSFFQGLIDSFVPTVAFADNEEAAPAPVEQEAPAPTPQEDVAASEDAQTEAVEAPLAEEPEEEAPVEEAASPATEEPTAEEEAPAAEEPTEEASEEEDDEDEDEEDEDEEEGTADPLEKLRAECAAKADIQPYVHHYAECVERVTAAQQEEGYEDRHYKEDCVEEFFHLQHHINDCVAPRLFFKLK